MKKVTQAPGYMIDPESKKVFNNKGKEISQKDGRIRLTLLGGMRKHFKVDDLLPKVEQVKEEIKQTKKNKIKAKRMRPRPTAEKTASVLKTYKEKEKILYIDYKKLEEIEVDFVAIGCFSCGYPAAIIRVNKRKKIVSAYNIRKKV